MMAFFRHPSFQGMREDKKAKEVVREEKRPLKKLLWKGGQKINMQKR
jgi:bifunctional non-homologous end joining protein LigD